MRVLAVLAAPPHAAWHRRAVDLVRREGADVFELVAESGAPVPAAAIAAADLVIDLAGVAIEAMPRHGVWRYGFAAGARFAHGADGTLARLYSVGADRSFGTVLREGWFRAASADAPGTTDVEGRVAGWCGAAVRQLTIDAAAVAGLPTCAIAECGDLVPPDSGGLGARVAAAFGRWRRRERWTIGLLDASVDDILGGGDLPEPRWISGVPDDRYLADPFPVAIADAGVTLLAEEYPYREGRGRIVSVELRRDGSIVSSRPVLSLAHHAAYPFVLRDGAAAYCVPETAAAGTIHAYRVDRDGLQAPQRLATVAAVDPTLVRHGGRWWLFCTLHGDANQLDLHLFHAADWHGPWQPHALNPVKSDARSSRPAGALFDSRGQLYRPAQDCSRRYGGAVAINRIIELTATRFREEVAATLSPRTSWQWPDGLHTFNTIGGLAVVDALRVER